MASVLWLSLLALVATALIWRGSELLETASQRLALHYGLPAVVQGAVIVAVGSSFPELASVVIAALVHGTFDLGVGAIVGSAIFNILVIPAVSAMRSSPLSVSRNIVYKEAQFYMLAIAVLLLTFSFGVIYNTGGNGPTAVIGRPLALIPIGMYLLYIFIQYQDVSDYEPDVVEPSDGILREWGRLAISLSIIVVAVEALVRAALGFGELFNSPEFLWGLTIVAAGTSMPDAFVSVRAAASDANGEVSVANVLGSNTFDLLVAIPVGVLLIGETAINFALAVPMMGVLTLATIVLFTMMRTNLEISYREAVVLLGSYVLFVAWVLGETLGYVEFLPDV
ncbi:sodium:calcium antiporter [Haloferacaceae archaeon DSL9]